MSKNAFNSQFICRSCRQLLTQRCPPSRQFTNTASRSNKIPDFQATSFPELDNLLLEWRHRVFTPAALNKTHRALVYKKSRWPILENDPGVTVTMSDGEEVKLSPMTMFDRPRKRESVSRIASILSETDDAVAWAQIPAFLEGMKLSRQHVPVWFLQKLARKASGNGRVGVIKRCATAVKRTGMTLAYRPVTRELYLGIHERFVEARTRGEDFEKENQLAESLALIMESDDHCGGAIEPSKDTEDMRKNLTVVGVMLELAAARALSGDGAKDVDGKTGSYCKKLIALARDDVLRREEKERPEHAVEDWIPIANGIRMALEVNDLVVGEGRNAEAELKGALKEHLGRLDSAIQDESLKIRTEADGKPRRCLIMLNNLSKFRARRGGY